VWDQAANYHQLAGERAWAVYAHTDAKEHFLYCLQSLNHLQVSPDPNRLYMIHSTMQKIYDLEGGRTNQGQQLSTLAELAEKLDDDRRRAEVALWRARQAASMSDLPKTIHDANLAIDLAVAAQDVIIQSEGYWEWGWALLMQGQHEKAKEQFEKSLILAKTAKILPLEADGLHALGTIGLVTGDYDEAKKQFHHVLEISKKIDIRPRAAKSLANLGYIATAQGDHAASRNFSEQALCIHRETGEQKGVAIAIQHLADELIFEGDYASARSYLLEAMNIQETIQAHENLGVTLRSIGMLYHQLGDYSRAKEYYQRALRIFTDSGVRWYQGQALAFISLLYHHLGDNQKAVLTGQEGLIVAREINDRLGEGWLLDSLGHAFWGLGQLDRAAESYQLALSLRQKLNETHKTTESLAGLAHIALHQREFEKARQYVEQILEVGRLRGFAGTNEPFRIQLTCYQVLEACHDLRADEVIAKVYHQLLIYKETIKDVTLENSFLENVAAHREIIAAYRNKQKSIPGYQVQVSLPRVDIPSGHPIRAEENILITWTLHAPGDESFPTRQGCRQHRLLRLLEEAQAQGGAPNCDHLAQVLGVSRRTIERDLAALRNNPIKLPPTGGKMS
jgi:tetratricopeptide (TPR) repeat protein